jgi:hypothetical protein
MKIILPGATGLHPCKDRSQLLLANENSRLLRYEQEERSERTMRRRGAPRCLVSSTRMREEGMSCG